MSPRPLVAPFVALCLVLVAAACASSNAAVLDTAPVSAAPDTTTKTLMLVVNPSARARAGFDHAGQIIRGAATFNLTLLGIYEQPVGVRKSPFNRPFVSGAVTSVGAPPARPSLRDCSHLDTDFQKKKCKRENERAVKDYNDGVQKWKNDNGAALGGWKAKTSKILTHLAANGPTEEAANGWDLRGAFLQVGQNLKALETTRNCVVLLGGVAVRTPPEHLRADLLKGATVIIPGWTGTQKVQDRWYDRLSSAGAKPIILPQAVTDLKLVSTVASCLQGVS
jgi:hypothetical protein